MTLIENSIAQDLEKILYAHPDYVENSTEYVLSGGSMMIVPQQLDITEEEFRPHYELAARVFQENIEAVLAKYK